MHVQSRASVGLQCSTGVQTEVCSIAPETNDIRVFYYLGDVGFEEMRIVNSEIVNLIKPP
jgi:hypothetical protein